MIRKVLFSLPALILALTIAWATDLGGVRSEILERGTGAVTDRVQRNAERAQERLQQLREQERQRAAAEDRATAVPAR